MAKDDDFFDKYVQKTPSKRKGSVKKDLLKPLESNTKDSVDKKSISTEKEELRSDVDKKPQTKKTVTKKSNNSQKAH